MSSVEYVDLETARQASGLRLLIAAGVPSPWSQAAKAIIEYKNIPAWVVKVRPGDPSQTAWTGISNVPVAMHGAELPRSGWADILALTERLQPDKPLVPYAPDARVKMFGLAHEVMSEGGLLWNARLLMIDASFASQGRHGFSLQAASYLAPRYAHRMGCAAEARARCVQVLELLASELSDGPYFLDELSALDFYVAAAVNMALPLPPEQCPMPQTFRLFFEWLGQELGSDIPSALLEHRERVMSRYWTLPLAL
jgi:glutathione S-transferase